MSGPGAEHVRLARYVWAIGRTCSVKTALAVPKTLETIQKMIFNGFWHPANRIYMCVAHGQVLKNKYIYIYGLKPFESKSMDKILRK
jgi:hypothetical protein